MKKTTGQNSHPLRWLWKNSKGLKGFLALQVFCNVLWAASSVWFALLVRDVIDAASAAFRDPALLSHLYAAALQLGILIVIQLILRFACNYFGDKLTADFELKFREDLYKKLLKKEYGAIGAYHTGDLMNRLYSDITVIADGASTILPSVAATLTRLVSAVGVMAFLEWRFTIIFVGAGLVIFVLSRLLSGILKRMHKDMQSADGKARSFLQESLASLLVLKVFDAQEVTQKKAHRLQKEHYRLRLRRKILGALASVSFAAIFKFGYFGALLYCSLCMSGVIAASAVMTFGTLTAILQLVGQIQEPFGTLSGVLPRYFAMTASIERIQELEELPVDYREECTYADAGAFYRDLSAIRFDNITFAYERDAVLKNVDLQVKRGDFCVITGLSGIGKSTLLKLLLGVYVPREGSICFETASGDIPLSARVPGLFAYVPQGNFLFSGTIRENISFIREDATEEDIMEAARMACVTDFLPELPDGLDTVIGEKGYGLSEGQVQRIAIARALLHGAPVLLLDECTSALDEQTEHKLLSSLSTLTEKTCIIISHKKAAFDICDYEIVIKNKHAEKRELAHGSR